MKREIICLECDSKPAGQDLSYRALLQRVVTPPDQIKKVHGLALREMICDRCNTFINPSDKAVAVSTWNSGRYFEWESDYLEVK